MSNISELNRHKVAIYTHILTNRFPIISHNLQTTATNLLLAGIDVRFHTYADLGHEYDERMLKAILDFMQDTELHFETDSALTM